MSSEIPFSSRVHYVRLSKENSPKKLLSLFPEIAKTSTVVLTPTPWRFTDLATRRHSLFTVVPVYSVPCILSKREIDSELTIIENLNSLLLQDNHSTITRVQSDLYTFIMKLSTRSRVICVSYLGYREPESLRRWLGGVDLDKIDYA